MKKRWLATKDTVGDLVLINLEHVDYIRTDLGQLRVKFAADEHESRFDVLIEDEHVKDFIMQVGE